MRPNKDIIQTQFLRIVDNQIKENNPAETQLTIDRLMQKGYSREEARLLVAQCVAVEIFEVMQTNEPFNQTRYIQLLKKLPKKPV